jgi:hypothetical protein
MRDGKGQIDDGVAMVTVCPEECPEPCPDPTVTATGTRLIGGGCPHPIEATLVEQTMGGSVENGSPGPAMEEE